MLLKQNKIYKCIDLLHNDYKIMNTKIYVYNSKLSLFLHFLLNTKSKLGFKDIKMVYGGKCCGLHCENTIYLFTFNRKNINKDISKLSIIYDLYHELRHAYQYKYKAKKFNKYMQNYVNCMEHGYHDQWIERDANAFSRRMFKKYKNELNNILNIKNKNWFIIK